MTATTSNDKHPTADPAEYDAFFPSPYSLSQFTSARSNLSDANYLSPYTGGRWKILMLCTDERYLQMEFLLHGKPSGRNAVAHVSSR